MKNNGESKRMNRRTGNPADDNEIVWSRTITPQSHISQRVVALLQVAHPKKSGGV
jgi:hypothetical protein